VDTFLLHPWAAAYGLPLLQHWKINQQQQVVSNAFLGGLS